MQATASSRQAGQYTADDGERRQCDVESHLSKEGKARNLSSLSKFIFSFSDIPDMVSLHGGLPNASIFPFKAMKVELEDGTWLDMSAKDKVCCHKGILSSKPLPHYDLRRPVTYGQPQNTIFTILHSLSMAQTTHNELISSSAYGPSSGYAS